MRVIARLILALFCVGCFSFANAANHLPADSNLRSAYLGSDVWPKDLTLIQSQINRQLKTHFAEVIEILREQEQSSLNEAVKRIELRNGPLSASQRTIVRSELASRRTSHVQTLKEYMLRGNFPRNTGQSKSSVPIFVDEFGTHCAVGYLMHRSDSDDVVQQVVDWNNLAYVNELESGPALEWILQSGLTQHEAAMIQPGYPEPPEFDATLLDFEQPGFSVSKFGMTISELCVTQHSFQAEATDLRTQFKQGIVNVDSMGQPLDYVATFFFGLAIGEGVFNGGNGTYQPNLNNWLFVGNNNQNLFSIPDDGDDAIMHRVTYRLSTGDRFASMATVASSSSFNANFVPNGNALQISTFISDGAEPLGQGTILSEGGTLDDFAFIDAGGDDLIVTTYVLDIRSTDLFSGFVSFWNEFDVVLIGDVNCDGAINLLDIQPFVDSITNGFTDVKADINMDGSVDLLDVAGFVELLSGGN